MNAKDELELLRRHKSVINRISAERSELEDVLYKCTSRLDGMPKGNNGDRMGSLVARVTELQDDLAAELGEYLRVRDLLKAKIALLQDERFRNLLTFRYVALKNTWKNVADCMGYDERYVYKLHDGALAEYERLNN